MRTRTAFLAAGLATMFAFAPSLHANPTNPTVVSGSASFAASGPTLTVTNSPNAIINWQSFSIGASETTRFQQQSAASAVLNRVTGGDGSQILGALQSNGQVFLINPAGVFFGAGAQINVAGLVASTLNIADQDFRDGKLNFNAGALAGAVMNQGTISTPLGGSVILVGTSVENSGAINAPNGNVVLAAGRSVLLGDTAAPNVLAQIQASGEQVTNLGQIAVGGGQVGIYAGLIRQSGIVRADSANVDAGGTIVFKATKDVTLDAGSVTSANGGNGGNVTIEATGGTNLVSGSVSATGSSGQGGTIQLLGQNVGVIDNANVDASGATGGGTILVGGDYQGANASVMNANAVFTGVNTTLRADATDNGNGGKVILWSEQATRAYGAISAKGGPNGGNGGFVETSSKGYLDVTQAPDLSAPMGLGGTWLLDPSDIEVITGTGSLDGSTPTFTATADTSTVSNSVINTALDAGTSVTLDTSNPAGTQTGNITVSAPITKSTGTTIVGLTLNADNDIVVYAPISDTTGVATSGIDLSMTSGRTTTTGSVTMYGGMDLGLGNFTANKDVTLYNPGYKLGGTLTVYGTLTLGGMTDLTLSNPGYITHSVGSLVLTPNGGGFTRLTGTSSSFSYFNAGTVTITDGGTGQGVAYIDNLYLQTTYGSGTISVDTHFLTLQNGAYLYTPYLTMTSGEIKGAGTLNVYTDFSATGGAIAMTMAPSSGTPSASYQSFAYLTQQSGTMPSIPIAADSVSLTAPTIDIAAVATNVNAYSLSLTQQIGSLAVDVPLTYDSLSLFATSAGSGIALNSTITADSVSLSSDTGASFTPSTFVPRNGPTLKSLSISQGTGDLMLNVPLVAEAVSLTAYAGSIVDTNGGANDITATWLSMDAGGGGIGTAANPIETSVRYLDANAGVSDIRIVNTNPVGTPLSILRATVSEADVSIVNNTDILLSAICRDGCLSPSIKSVGGSISIQSTGGNIANDNTLAGLTDPFGGFVVNEGWAWLSAEGAPAGWTRPNGNGGTITLNAAGNIDLGFTGQRDGMTGALIAGTLEANGNSNGPDLLAGMGGTVNLIAGGSVNVGRVSAVGGAGSSAGNGASGGTVSITAPGGVTAGMIDVSGGLAGSGFTTANGGNGGQITINTDGNVAFGTYDPGDPLWWSGPILPGWTGGLFANGGDGGTTATDGGAGGLGGTISIVGNGGAGMTLTSPVPISASGGAGGDAFYDGVTAFQYLGNGGNGGNGGSIDIHTTNGGVLNIVGAGGALGASGGNGGLGLAQGAGGNGGNLNLASLDAGSTGGVNIAGLSIAAAIGIGSVNGAYGSAAISAGSGGVTQSLAAGDELIAANTLLKIASGGTVHLDNPANNFAAVFGTVNGDLFLRDVNGIGLGGLNATDTLNVTGNIDVRVLPGTGGLNYKVGAGGTGFNVVTILEDVVAGGNITLSADGFDFWAGNGASTVNSGSGAANYIAFLPLKNVVLDDLSAADLNRLNTPLLRIGDPGGTTTASVDLGISTGPNNPIWLYSSNDLSIFTAGNVTQYSGASLVVGDGVGGLQVSAGNVSLTDPGNSFAVLAGRAGTDLVLDPTGLTPGSFNVTNGGSFTVGTVDGVVGIGALPGATVNLTATGGTLSIQAAAAINVNGAWNFNAPGGLINAGTLNLDSGLLTEDGAFTNAAGGVVNLNGATWTRPVGSIFGNAGTVNVNAGALALDGGDGGVGGGAYNLGGGTNLTLGGVAMTYAIGSLTGTGTFDVTGGTANVTSANFTGATTVNGASAAFNIGGGSLGTLTVGPTAGSQFNVGGNTSVSGLLTNDATVNANTGTLSLSGGGVGSGAYNLASGATLSLAGGNYVVGNIAATTGTVNLSAGALDITGTATVGTMNHTGGILGGGAGGTGNLSVANYTLAGGSFGNAFNTLSLSNAANLTFAGVTVSANNLALSAGTQLLIDGSTLSGGTVTLAAPTVALRSSTAAASTVSAMGNMTVNAPTQLLLDGATGAAKLTAGGTLTINAGAVDVLAGAASASIDPTLLTLTATGNLTLAGGSGVGAVASIVGDSVTASAAGVSLSGGTGANSSATISALTGNLTLNTSGPLTMTAGATGTNADAVLTAPLGAIQVVALTCAGCNTLSSDPSVNTTSDVGSFALTGVSFIIAGELLPPPDNSATQALALAGSGGSGTSNVSNTPSGDESEPDTQESGGRNERKKLSVCR